MKVLLGGMVLEDVKRGAWEDGIINQGKLKVEVNLKLN